MQPIPEPELLDPDRALTNERDDMTVEDHRNRAELLADALRESCSYARQVWKQLDDVRGYLVASLPDSPEQPGPRREHTAPTGPDDEEGWQRWMDTYAAVTATLAGPRGDSGFGADEARMEARARRVAPVPVRPTPPAAGTSRPPPAERRDDLRARVTRWAPIVGLGLLAIRGLRPRGR